MPIVCPCVAASVEAHASTDVRPKESAQRHETDATAGKRRKQETSETTETPGTGHGIMQ